MKLLLYCTKAKPYLLCEPYIDKNKPCRLLRTELDKTIYNCAKEKSVNGKIVAECDFEVEEISRIKSWNSTEDYDWEYETPTLCYYDLLRKSCLMCDEFEEYIEFNGYAIHIKNLHIFDKPKELKEYDDVMANPLNEAPQNMRYAFKYFAESMYINDQFQEYILISIQPEWLCKILNGEKTIEVRKKVLKEMLE